MHPDRSAAQGGFTLLEVMVAFVIAGLCLSLLYEGTTGGLQATQSAAKTEEAVSLARSHLAAIGRGQGIAQQESNGADGDDFSWHLSIRPVGTRQLTLTDSDRANDQKPSSAVLFDVSVTESWTEGGHSHSVTLATRRLDVRQSEG